MKNKMLSSNLKAKALAKKQKDKIKSINNKAKRYEDQCTAPSTPNSNNSGSGGNDMAAMAMMQNMQNQ